MKILSTVDNEIKGLKLTIYHSKVLISFQIKKDEKPDIPKFSSIGHCHGCKQIISSLSIRFSLNNNIKNTPFIVFSSRQHLISLLQGLSNSFLQFYLREGVLLFLSKQQYTLMYFMYLKFLQIVQSYVQLYCEHSCTF